MNFHSIFEKIRYELSVLRVIGIIRFSKKLPYFILKRYRSLSLEIFGNDEVIKWHRNKYNFKAPFSGNWFNASALKIDAPLFLKEKKEILEKASKAKNGDFFINGISINVYKKNKEGSWSDDPISGNKWESRNIFKPIGTYKYDLRFPWELDRMQHLILFGQAWRCSNEIKWPEAGLLQLKQLLNQDKFEYGIHWRDGLQISVRIFSMIGFADLCHDFTDDFHKEITQIIALHAYSLSRQISPESEITNNHKIGELCGLILSGIYLNNKKYFKESTKKLKTELDRQIYNDGIPYEGSIPYIRFILEFLILTEIAIRNSDFEDQTFLIIYIEKISYALSSLVDSLGNIPPIGDGDDGRVLKFDDEPYLNVNETLLIASELIKKSLSPIESNYSFKNWVLGGINSDLKRLNKISFLKDSGLIHLNHKKYDVWLDCGPTGLGKYGPGGHGHNDTTSIVFYYDGKPILHDPGWFSYFKDKSIRNYFRSTFNHNTITINNKEQARLGTRFEILNECYPSETKIFKKNNEFIILCGHNGFNRIDRSIKFQRIIKFSFEDNFKLQIKDIVKSKSPILVSSHLGSNFIWNRNLENKLNIFENKFTLEFISNYSKLSIDKKKYSLSNSTSKVGSALNWNFEYVGKNTMEELIYLSNWYIYKNTNK